MHTEIINRFWDKVEKRGDDDCWLWKGSKSKNGYGEIWVSGKIRRATQIMWEIFNNQEFPSDKETCHICDNPSCVNPKHFWAGTRSENVLDAIKKGRNHRVKRTHCDNGHEYTEENTYVKFVHGKPHRICRVCSKLKQRKRRKDKKSGLIDLKAEIAALREQLDGSPHSYIRQLKERIEGHIEENQALREELETERMRLVACGVIAMANTPESAKKTRIPKDNPYYSASLNDVEAAVDREIALRERQRVLVEAVKKSYLKHWLDDHSIGYAELGTVLMDALCNTLGDDGFSKWIGDYHKALAAKEG